MAKKNFKITETNVIPVNFASESQSSDLIFKTNKGVVDFNRWLYFERPKMIDLKHAVNANREQLVFDIYNAITQLSFEMASTTVEVLAAEGAKQLFAFLDDQSKSGNHIASIEQFNRSLIDQFLIWIRNKPAKTKTGKLSTLGARRYFTSIKSILMYFTRQGRISKEIFPYAPFVNVNRSGNGTEPYSKSEYSRVMRYLWQQLELIRSNEFNGSHRQMVAIYALLIAAKTGRNTSTILSLKSDCITPHPLAPDTHVILTGFKKRGMNTSVQAMRGSETIDDVFTSHKDIETLVNEVLDLTQGVRDGSLFNELFLTLDIKKNTILVNESVFWAAVQGIYAKADLFDDQGQPLKIQIKRMRKTFATRIWQLTGGDPIKTSKMLGNTVPVMNKHYLDITPEMEKNHKLFGHVLTETLLNDPESTQEAIAKKLDIGVEQVKGMLIGNFNTGVGRCSDPYNGKFAKDGAVCTRFVACFRCPNQVVLESDLYRLFSFYWLLIKERSFIGRKKWKKLYSWVIKVIEKEIEPLFDIIIVETAKNNAKSKPHPMWVDRFSLGAI